MSGARRLRGRYRSPADHLHTMPPFRRRNEYPSEIVDQPARPREPQCTGRGNYNTVLCFLPPGDTVDIKQTKTFFPLWRLTTEKRNAIYNHHVITVRTALPSTTVHARTRENTHTHAHARASDRRTHLPI